MLEHQFIVIEKLLTEIRDLLKEQQANQQPTTKITVVGNKAGQNTTKGMKSDEDFKF
jgi:hypothetical protein